MADIEVPPERRGQTKNRKQSVVDAMQRKGSVGEDEIVIAELHSENLSRADRRLAELGYTQVGVTSLLVNLPGRGANAHEE